MNDKRITVRFNEAEQAELDRFKTTYHIENDSEAIKAAIEWVNAYIKNVTNSFFPPNYEVILSKKMKTQTKDRLIYS